MDIYSSERVDVLPGFTRAVKTTLPIPENVQLSTSKDGIEIKYVDARTVSITNKTKRTYSIYPDDNLGGFLYEVVVGVPEEIASFESKPVTEAFSGDAEELSCPLCGKKYKNTPRGEEFLRNHMYKEHNTII